LQIPGRTLFPLFRFYRFLPCPFLEFASFPCGDLDLFFFFLIKAFLRQFPLFQNELSFFSPAFASGFRMHAKSDVFPDSIYPFFFFLVVFANPPPLLSVWKTPPFSLCLLTP